MWAACFWTENNPITAGKPHGVCSPLCCRLLSRRDFNLSTVPPFFYLYFSNPQLSSSPKKKKVPPSFSTAFISIPSSTFHNYMSPFLHDSLCSAAAFYPLTQFLQRFQRTIMEFYSTLAPPAFSSSPPLRTILSPSSLSPHLCIHLGPKLATGYCPLPPAISSPLFMKKTPGHRKAAIYHYNHVA